MMRCCSSSSTRPTSCGSSRSSGNLDEVARLLAPERVAETAMLRIVARLDRITEIQKLLVDQIAFSRR